MINTHQRRDCHLFIHIRQAAFWRGTICYISAFLRFPSFVYNCCHQLFICIWINRPNKQPMMPEATTFFAFLIFYCSTMPDGKPLITYLKADRATSEVIVPIFNSRRFHPCWITSYVCGILFSIFMLSHLLAYIYGCDAPNFQNKLCIKVKIIIFFNLVLFL